MEASAGRIVHQTVLFSPTSASVRLVVRVAGACYTFATSNGSRCRVSARRQPLSSRIKLCAGQCAGFISVLYSARPDMCRVRSLRRSGCSLVRPRPALPGPNCSSPPAAAQDRPDRREGPLQYLKHPHLTPRCVLQTCRPSLPTFSPKVLQDVVVRVEEA